MNGTIGNRTPAQRIRAVALAFCSAAFLSTGTARGDDAGPSQWPGYRGPTGDGIAQAAFFDATGGIGVAWKQDLGPGYSAISVADGRAVTLFSDGQADLAIAFDTATGAELWRYRLGKTIPAHDGNHGGPGSTPLIAGGRVFALSLGGRLVALDLASGSELWSHLLVEDLDFALPFHGFAGSPAFSDGAVILQAGPEDSGEILAFDAASGEMRWREGQDSFHYGSPIVAEIAGRRQILAVGGTQIYGLDPATGETLWSYGHGADGQGVSRAMTAVPVGANRIFLSHRATETQVLEVVEVDGLQAATPVWKGSALRGSYNLPVLYEGFLYGYSQRFLTCVDAVTGEIVWKSRSPGDGFLSLVDGQLVITTKKGSLHVAQATPAGYEEVARLEPFTRHAWTEPSFAAGRIYARSLGEIVAIEPAGGAVSGLPLAEGQLPDSSLTAFVASLRAEDDKTGAVDRFMSEPASFPILEGDSRLHFVYRGEAEDMAVTGDLSGFRHEAPMHRVPGTDLFYFSVELDPETRLSYQFVKDFEETILDPLNPRGGPDMFGEFSSAEMPGWQAPAHLIERESPRGRLETVELAVAGREETVRLAVYLPQGYDASEQRYPVAYVHGAGGALGLGRWETALGNLVGERVQDLIAVFIYPGDNGMARLLGPETPTYSDELATLIVPEIDRRFRTLADRAQRASVGAAMAAHAALYSAFAHPQVFGLIAAQSAYMQTEHREPMAEMMPQASEAPMKIYLEWGRYDFRGTFENWGVRKESLALREDLRAHGYQPAGGEVPDGFGWASWRNRTDQVLEALFPLTNPE